MLFDDFGYLSSIYKDTKIYGNPCKLKAVCPMGSTREFAKALLTEPTPHYSYISNKNQLQRFF